MHTKGHVYTTSCCVDISLGCMKTGSHPSHSSLSSNLVVSSLCCIFSLTTLSRSFYYTLVQPLAQGIPNPYLSLPGAPVIQLISNNNVLPVHSKSTPTPLVLNSSSFAVHYGIICFSLDCLLTRTEVPYSECFL